MCNKSAKSVLENNEKNKMKTMSRHEILQAIENRTAICVPVKVIDAQGKTDTVYISLSCGDLERCIKVYGLRGFYVADESGPVIIFVEMENENKNQDPTN